MMLLLLGTVTPPGTGTVPEADWTGIWLQTKAQRARTCYTTPECKLNNNKKHNDSNDNHDNNNNNNNDNNNDDAFQLYELSMCGVQI